MEIVKSRDRGFCFGVRRTVEMMEREAVGGRPIASLGSVVHNPQVVERLRDRGLAVITEIDDIDGRRLAITAHGVGPAVIEDAEARGLELVDTTCPIVTRAQQWAKKMECIEARLTLAGLPGKNEAERKAALLLALLDDAAYRNADALATDAADQQRAAERDVRVLTERCRLLRASLALHASG